MSRVMRKPIFSIIDQADTNRAVMPQKMARGLKVRMQEEEGLFYLCSENKGADQLHSYCFAYAKSRFSHDASQIIETNDILKALIAEVCTTN